MVTVPDWVTNPHGHVKPRKDGALARCGGPGICAQCADEAQWVAFCERLATAIPPARMPPPALERQDWEWFGVA